MFKKPLGALKSFSPLRSSDRRRFQAEIYDAYPALKVLKEQERDQEQAAANSDEKGEKDEKDATAPTSAPVVAPPTLFPDTLKAAKFVSHCEKPGTVYVDNSNPLWFKTLDGPPVPSVYTLWQYPTMLPTLYTWGPVVQKLIEGADLMIPGLVGAVPPNLQPGDLVAITIRGYGYPLAIGTMALPSAEIKVRSGMKGKAVYLLHVFQDHLWAMGNKSEPPAITALDDDKEGGETDDEKHENAQQQPSETTSATPTPPAPVADTIAAANDTSKRSYTVQEVDEILKEALIQGLLYKLTRERATTVLPISTSSLYTSYLLPCRPRGIDPDVDIKKSSWKKVQKFTKAMEKLGILKVKEQRGESNVTTVNWTHPSLQGVSPYKYIKTQTPEDTGANNAEQHSSTANGTASSPAGTSAGAAGAAAAPIQITDMYKAHQAGTRALFDAVKKDTGAYYTAQQVRDVALAYIQQEDLVNPSNRKMIKIDAVLTDAILSKDEYQTVHQLGRDQIVQRLVAKLQPFHMVTLGNKEPLIKKGTPKPVEITQETRQGRKTMTKVTGMESFGMDIDELCKELTKLCASSATSNAIAGTSPKAPLYEVLVQGPQIKHVSELLLRKGVPKKFIMVHDKTAKKKGKK
ncbi:hypothetical protein BC940DRAFT_341718 [Gongronella butleri]|nr:hypothetical protein BC940DRAFT_341718 [Gongronella butleri]